MAISFERSFSVHDDALLLRGRRSSILAANIANADTPDYKARDFDFAAAMRKANMHKADQQQVGSVALASTHRNHLSPRGGALLAMLMYRNPLHASLDGNTVDSHVEQTRFSENALLFQTSFTFLNGKVQGLMKALQGE
jgi:flagellar basal-body rod protein FlgB